MQLDMLRSVLEHDGPFVTVHADVSRNDEHGLDRIDAQCTAVRHELEHRAVDGTLAEAVEERLRRAPEGAGELNRTVVAAGTEILLDEDHPGSPSWREPVTVGPLPSLTQWVLANDDEVTFVVVLADREGADVEVHSTRTPRPRWRRELHGETQDITKVAPGDWAQKQYQRRAENVWHGNAEMVARQLRSVYDDVRPRFIALAGDPRARAEIVAVGEHLPITQVESGGRGAGASQESLWAEVDRLVAQEMAREEAELMERLEQGRGRRSGVVDGLEATLDALARAEADTVVADLRALHELSTCPADHPGLPLPAEAIDERGLPADDVLIAAAAGTGAGLTTMPAEQIGPECVAATLRWDLQDKPRVTALTEAAVRSRGLATSRPRRRSPCRVRG